MEQLEQAGEEMEEEDVDVVLERCEEMSRALAAKLGSNDGDRWGWGWGGTAVVCTCQQQGQLGNCSGCWAVLAGRQPSVRPVLLCWRPRGAAVLWHGFSNAFPSHCCCVCCRYGATEEAPASLVTLKDLVAACGEAARFFKPYQVGWCHDSRREVLHCADWPGDPRHYVSCPCSLALQDSTWLACFKGPHCHDQQDSRQPALSAASTHHVSSLCSFALPEPCLPFLPLLVLNEQRLKHGTPCSSAAKLTMPDPAALQLVGVNFLMFLKSSNIRGSILADEV